jgi:hypothetical protein
VLGVIIGWLASLLLKRSAQMSIVANVIAPRLPPMSVLGGHHPLP